MLFGLFGLAVICALGAIVAFTVEMLMASIGIRDLVAESGRKAIIFSQWVQPLETLAQHLKPYGPLLYHGKIPQCERQPILDRFRALGYAGYVSLELMNPTLWQAKAVQVVEVGLTALRKVLGLAEAA